ncbi:uncharacterized protein LOC114124821 isoform X2 [Aphis gossypii]|uniref:uncharacterized protein LOC114124821 isoform X2 n=1 Tax=Aphis gossypii TaxID=80765 RepID=UPI00215926A3|nr:uncharacterized protein LOC114124821 isoform X2 [Aphis gossypii]
MIKPIYCNLLLIFSCLVYEAYGSHPYNDSLSSSTTINDAEESTATLESATQPPPPRHRRKSFSSTDGVRYGRFHRSVQDNRFTNNINPYNDSLSSSTTVNDSEENTTTLESAAQSPSPRHRRKSFSSTDALGYDRNRKSVQDNRSTNNINPYNDSLSSSTTVNDAEENTTTLESAAQSPSPRHRRKSFSSTNGLRYGRLHRSVHDNKFPRRMNRRMTLTPPCLLRNNLRKSMRNTKQPMFRLSSFNRFGHSFNEDSDTQETESPKNMRLGSTGYLPISPSFGSSNGIPDMDSEKIKPNYPYSEPIGVSKDEANEIRNDVLQKSNFYRNKFDLEPFTLDDQLNNCAQNWANYMAKQQLFDHRPENVYGENLYGNLNLKDLGKTAVDSWYNEMSLFTIGNEENVDTFHMTQLLWKESTKLGVGVSRNPGNGMYYVVANYDPRGNLLDNFKENLPEITEEDIEEAKEADKRLKAKMAKPVVMSKSSGSSIPFRSG